MIRLLAASVGAGALARLGTQTAQAANGDPVLAGQTVDATAPTRVRNGVSYTPDATADGIQGYATGANNAGLFGRNNVTDGIGVFGESVNGFGVGGKAPSGVGGAFSGGRAAIRLVPAASGTGPPTSTSESHQVGELYADSAGSIFYCTVAGSPGTWVPVVFGAAGGEMVVNGGLRFTSGTRDIHTTGNASGLRFYNADALTSSPADAGTCQLTVGDMMPGAMLPRHAHARPCRS
jgi:hypothetical protein